MDYVLKILLAIGAYIGYLKLKDVFTGFQIGRLNKKTSDKQSEIDKQSGKLDDLTKQYEKDLKDYEAGIDSSINPSDTEH